MKWLSGTLSLSGGLPRVRVEDAGLPAGHAEAGDHIAPIIVNYELGTAPPVAAATRTSKISLDNVLKLVPAEVIAPFTIIADQYKADRNGLMIWFGILLVVCLGVRAEASRPSGAAGSWFAQVNWRLVIVSGVAFVIWAHAVSVEPPLLDFLKQTSAGIAAMVFGAVAPRFVPGVLE